MPKRDPKPHYPSDVLVTMNTRVEAEYRQAVKVAAAQRGVSMVELIRTALDRELRRKGA